MKKHLDRMDVHREMQKACAAAGGQKLWADRHMLSAQYVSDVLNARREPGPGVLRALGLKKVTRYVKARIVNG